MLTAVTSLESAGGDFLLNKVLLLAAIQNTVIVVRVFEFFSGIDADVM
jgi:hypothetical protein